MIRTAMACLVASFVNARFLGPLRRIERELGAAARVSHRRRVGRARRLSVLWIFILACWTVAVAIGVARLPHRFGARVLGMLGIISFAFLLFALGDVESVRSPRSRPRRMAVTLNPLLQDPALAIHPPMLYTGYVGFSVAFAFAVRSDARRQDGPGVGALDAPVDHGRVGLSLDGHRARQLVGVLRARLGRLLVLGCGGKRVLHAMACGHRADPLARGHRQARPLQELDAAARNPRVLAEPARHVPRALGQHHVGSRVRGRSGARYVHPRVLRDHRRRGAGSRMAWRAPLLKSQAGFDVLSRESFLLFNNILLVIATAIVFGGTLAPLIAEAIGYTLSMGTPYFNAMFPDAHDPAARAGAHRHPGELEEGATEREEKVGCWMGLGDRGGAGHGRGARNIRPLARAHAGRATPSRSGSCISSLDRSDRSHPARTVAFARRDRNDASRTWRLAMLRGRHHLGGVVHAGARYRRRPPARRSRWAIYAFRFDKIENIEGPNYDGVRGYFSVTQEGKPILNLEPEKRLYWVQRQGMTEAGIGSYWGSNIFLALGDDLGAGKWSVRLQVRPLVNYVWPGRRSPWRRSAARLPHRIVVTASAKQPEGAGEVVAGEGALPGRPDDESIFILPLGVFQCCPQGCSMSG